MPKFYFQTETSEMCYSLSYHLDKAKEQGMTEIELFEAVPMKDDKFFWCRAAEQIAENGCCGLDCIAYQPCNKKSGKCRFKQNTMFEHGKKVKFEIKLIYSYGIKIVFFYVLNYRILNDSINIKKFLAHNTLLTIH